MKDGLGRMWGYRYQERMGGERLDQVFYQEVILQLGISVWHRQCW
jgi:hypothetical protein